MTPRTRPVSCRHRGGGEEGRPQSSYPNPPASPLPRTRAPARHEGSSQGPGRGGEQVEWAAGPPGPLPPCSLRQQLQVEGGGKGLSQGGGAPPWGGDPNSLGWGPPETTEPEAGLSQAGSGPGDEKGGETPHGGAPGEEGLRPRTRFSVGSGVYFRITTCTSTGHNGPAPSSTRGSQAHPLPRDSPPTEGPGLRPPGVPPSSAPQSLSQGPFIHSALTGRLAPPGPREVRAPTAQPQRLPAPGVTGSGQDGRAHLASSGSRSRGVPSLRGAHRQVPAGNSAEFREGWGPPGAGGRRWRLRAGCAPGAGGGGGRSARRFPGPGVTSAGHPQARPPPSRRRSSAGARRARRRRGRRTAWAGSCPDPARPRPLAPR